jgi:hypothetical protein
MYLEKQREAELEKRKGSARKTIISLLWLGTWAAIGYFAVQWLVENEYFSPAAVLRLLNLPPEVPEAVVVWGAVLGIVFVAQVALTLGFMFGSPRGRQKLGRPTRYSSNPDPLDRNF